MKRLSPRLTIFAVCAALLSSVCFGQITTSPSGSFPTTNLVYVDSVNGSDSTGLAHRGDRPFLTCSAAKTAASSGDTIVVLPGTYTPSANLAKNGVNWYLYSGATISATGNFDLFTDSGGVTSYIVSGTGRILLSGHGTIFRIANSSSIVRVTASEVIQSVTADALGAAEGAFYQTAGELYIKADKISGKVSGVYWDDGIMFVDAGLITGTIGAIYSQSAAANSNAHIKANEISCLTSGDPPIQVGGSASAAIWITAHHILAQDYVALRDGVKLYITAQKLQITSSLYSIVKSQGGGFLYIDAQKAEALSAPVSSSPLFDLVAGDSYIAIHQLVCSTGVVDAAVITDGNHFFRADRIDVLGNGIVSNSSGNVSVVGAHITTGAAKKDLIQGTDGVVEVRGCFYSTAKTTGTITQGDPAFASYQPLDSDLTTWAGITPGTGVGTALGINVGSAGAFVTYGGAGSFTTVAQTGKTTTYNNIATEGNGLGAIVKATRVTAQTAANSSIATYTTPASDGSYLVSGNINVTAAITISTSLNCDYTDETNTARTMIIPISGLGGTFLAGGLATSTGPFESGVMHIRTKASTAIKIYTAAGTFTSATYNAEGVIRQLQ